MMEPARPPAEADLAARLAADLEGTFEELVVTHQDRVYAFLLGMTRDGGQAEDLAQETFWKAYRALGRYPSARVAELRVGPWLRRIALNTQRNAVRGRRVGQALVPDPPQQADPNPAGDPEAQTLRRGEQERLLRALAAVSPPARAAILLHHAEDLPVEEVAEVLHLPEGTVKSHVHRGLARLRRALDEEEAQP
jgi:RNA polymerase sigma-70 factor (ECF subfamily)